MERKGNKREYRRLYVIEESDTVLKGWSKKELRELGGRHYKNVKLNDDDISTTSVWKIPVDCRKIIESKVNRESCGVGDIRKTACDISDIRDIVVDISDIGDIEDIRYIEDIRDIEDISDIRDIVDIVDIGEKKGVVPKKVKSLEIENLVTCDRVKRSTTSSKSTNTTITNTTTVTVGTNTDTDTDMKIIQFSDYKLDAFQEIRDRCQQYSEMVEFTKPTRTKY